MKVKAKTALNFNWRGNTYHFDFGETRDIPEDCLASEWLREKVFILAESKPAEQTPAPEPVPERKKRKYVRRTPNS